MIKSENVDIQEKIGDDYLIELHRNNKNIWVIKDLSFPIFFVFLLQKCDIGILIYTITMLYLSLRKNLHNRTVVSLYINVISLFNFFYLKP